MANFLKRLVAGEEGATMVEYALMVALIAAAAVVAVKALSTAVNGQFNSIAAQVAPAAS
jgi:pilus assembly protein Flp/PilA